MAIKKIATVTVGAGGAASIDFNSISGSYTDLMLVYNVRTDRSGLVQDNTTLKFNGSSANVTDRSLYGAGSGSGLTATSTGGLTYAVGAGATSSTFGNTVVYIPNYAGSTNKSYYGDSVTETNATTAYMSVVGGIWAQTAAITSLSITQVGTIQQYSTATLYGVTKGSLAGVTVS